ncbi:bifunctional GNAT family N-acetyltransferase/NUDIX hydrolase [Blastococcus goldschmidtiae]|uniref:Bifunctional GNAT family N-acetyltransferase/NUDIX hydrolase n=1 Tax=Blastococcus goldschmidtiae TaxID=3075546 RepID=A0ABU2K3C8_9ACTN|nr:bifunctional GNAT family N-acetyltransferase/NUDIX hydrolase [Blastococcus sp. DSM 46792]MDT0274692.1 bifunctional GNAT family N-acetyltransferase/NUDIX hydrolase [Blastococcus sp. DSM 46792]
MEGPTAVGRTRAVHVRRRSDDDLPALRRLAESMLQRDGYPPRVPHDLGRFIAAPGALAAFVAVSDGEVVGHVCVSPSGSPEVLDLARRALGVPEQRLAVVARLVVARPHRRQGTARTLLAEALTEVLRLGRTPVLDVATHLAGAIALYERAGWRRLGQVSVAISGAEPLDEYVYVGPLGLAADGRADVGDERAGDAGGGPGVRSARRLTAMAGWHPDCYQRAIAYVTDPSGRLLVFEHLDVAAGTQVPGGGIHVGESAEEAVLRELAEESGLDSALVVRKLGEAWNRSEPGNVPAGLEEQIQHAFHLRLGDAPRHERWEWEERSGGDVVEHRHEFRWIAVDEAERVLWPSQAMWVDAVRLSLRHPA